MQAQDIPPPSLQTVPYNILTSFFFLLLAMNTFYNLNTNFVRIQGPRIVAPLVLKNAHLSRTNATNVY